MEEPIGARVRRLRKEKGWTQNVLSYHAETAATVVSQVETGTRQPEISTVKKLANALEVDWRWLLLGDEFSPKGGAPESVSGHSDGNRLAEMFIKLGDLQVAEWKSELAERVEDGDQEWFDRMQEAYFLYTDILGAMDITKLSNPEESHDRIMRMANFAQTVRETVDPDYQQRFEEVLQESGEKLEELAKQDV